MEYISSFLLLTHIQPWTNLGQDLIGLFSETQKQILVLLTANHCPSLVLQCQILRGRNNREVTLESFFPLDYGWIFFSQVRALLLYTYLHVGQEETMRNLFDLSSSSPRHNKLS